jgi:O-antigen ligase
MSQIERYSGKKRRSRVPTATEPDKSSTLGEAVRSNLALFTLLTAIFGIWISQGVNIGVQRITVTQVMSVLGFILTVYSVSTRNVSIPTATRVAFERLMFFFALMIVAILLSSLNAIDPFDSIRFVGRWVYGMMLAGSIFVLTDGDPEALRRIIRAFIYGGLATTIACYAGFKISFLAGIVFQDLWQHRAQGFVEHPNQLGMLYLAAIIMAFWPKLFSVVVRVGVIIILGAGLILTGSKFNVAVALILVPMIMFWLPAREGRVANASVAMFFGAPLGILMVVVAAITIKAYNTVYFGRLLTFVDNPSGGDSATSRVDLWSQSFVCWEKHPVLGIGAGNADQCVRQAFSHVHNVFINYLLETGLLGLILFCVFLLYVFYTMNEVGATASKLPGTKFGKNDSYRNIALVTISSLAYVISNCSSDSMGAVTMFFLWMNIGIMLALHKYVFTYVGRGLRKSTVLTSGRQ